MESYFLGLPGQTVQRGNKDTDHKNVRVYTLHTGLIMCRENAKITTTFADKESFIQVKEINTTRT